MRIPHSALFSAFFLLHGALAPAYAGDKAHAPSNQAIALDKQIDWSEARLIAVQDGMRYKTLDSFARESMHAMTGKEHFPELSPMATLMEWLFNRDAYADVPVIKIRDTGLRYHFSAHMRNDAARNRIVQTGMMTPREFADETVQARIEELEPRNTMGTAIGRVRNAQAVAQAIDRMCSIVPQPGGKPEDPWHTPRALLANVPPEFWQQQGLDQAASRGQFGQPIRNLEPAQALQVLLPWVGLRDAWLKGDAPAVQENLKKLQDVLPALAGTGVYPSRSQRLAEARYYAMNKMTYGWIIYLLAALFSVWAVVTGWRFPRRVSLAFLFCAMAFHGYGVALRWFILGRIPNANMFEAIVFAALVAIAVAVVLELAYGSNLFALGASVGGFFALMLACFVPALSGGMLTSLMGILDDLMLRIHTVLIIVSYGLIFIGAVIALVYLFGYYAHHHVMQSLEAGLTAALLGLWLLMFLYIAFQQDPHAANAAGYVKKPWVGPSFWAASVVLLTGAALWKLLSLRGLALVAVVLGGVAAVTVAIGNYGFVSVMAWVMIGGGATWAAGNGLAMMQAKRRGSGRGFPAAAGALSSVGATLGLNPKPALAGVGPMAIAPVNDGGDEGIRREERPVLAGGMPGDERGSGSVPGWLNNVDWCHLIILNLVFVLLFVGTILGAVWADYSWGRPWGWDPKEVFALNTWIIYAILIHTRFVVKKRGLWTAWLSVAGCLMMAFNWCFVNFYIVGLHSYA